MKSGRPQHKKTVQYTPYRAKKGVNHEDSVKRSGLPGRSMGNLLPIKKPNYEAAIYQQRENDEIVLFWQKQSIFSQWHQSVFTVDELTFNCAEQFMMYHKAGLCDDPTLREKIMTSLDPAEQKALGRQAGAHPSFQRKKWDSICYDIVKQGNIAKFSQNQKLKSALLKTHSKILAEASPFDKKWGIGLAADHPDAFDTAKWQGQNYLGKALMEVREELWNDQNK